MGLTVLKTPVRSPQANAFCERLIGTIRRECLDWLILVNEQHLRFVLRDWVAHYNQGRPHASLGPAFPTGRSARWRGHTSIESLMDTESSPPRSWRSCITNIG
jgi:transposase InsO family protein